MGAEAPIPPAFLDAYAPSKVGNNGESAVGAATLRVPSERWNG